MSNTAAGGDLVAIRKLLVSYLIARGDEAPPPPAAAGVDLTQYEGWYRQLTPNLDFMRLLTDLVDFRRVKAGDGALELTAGFSTESTRLIPLGEGLFAKEGRTAADRVFVTTPEGALEMHDFFQGAYRKVSPASVYGRLAFFGLAALAGLLAILSTLLWVFLRPFGVFRHSNRWRVWALPLLSLAAYVAAGVLLVLAASGFSDAAARLGGPTPWSIGLLAATIAGPGLAVLGLLGAFFARRVAPLARLQAGTTAALFIALGAYLWKYGWVGLTIWSYQPGVTGH